jgi:hypothetical protein
MMSLENKRQRELPDSEYPFSLSVLARLIGEWLAWPVAAVRCIRQHKNA